MVKTYHGDTIPIFELLDEKEVKVKEVVVKDHFYTCNACEQRVKKENGKYVPHTRRVFRAMTGDGYPDYVVELCPNGVSE